jgi:hypothetical protein
MPSVPIRKAEVAEPPPHGTLPEAVIDALHLRRIGAGRWRGACAICGAADSFDAVLGDMGLRCECTACAGDANRMVWLLLGFAAQARRRAADDGRSPA